VGDDRGHPDGRVFLAAATGLHVRAPGGRWTTYTAAQGLPRTAATDVVVAGDGAAWVATTGGLVRFVGR